MFAILTHVMNMIYRKFKYIHVLEPCPTDWRSDPAKSIELSKLAVQTGVWPLYEIEKGDFKVTYKPKEFKPVSEYLRPQRRFRHLSDESIQEIQQMHNDDWQRLLEKDGTNIW